MDKEERIAALKAEFEEYTERLHPNIMFTEHDLNAVFREWMFGKIADLQESINWMEPRVWRA